MTVGQGDPTSINAAAGTSDVARRVQMMADQGHQWMDPQTTLALANSNMSDGSLSAAAQQLKGMFNSSTAAVSHVFTDPVLQKTPSFSSSLSQWMGSNVGYLPVEQSDLAETQRKLQALGYGAGLPTDGTWDSSWNDQYQQAAYKHLLEQSNQVGQVVPPHKVAHGFLSSLFPSHAIPALWGMVKSTPGDLRSLVADVAGGAAHVGQGLTNLTGMHPDSSGSVAVTRVDPNLGSRVAADVEHALGNSKITAQNIADHPTARLVNDISTLMMFLPIGKVASPLAKSLGEDILKGTVKDAFTRTLDQQVAQRGPGIIANSLVRNAKGGGFDLLGKLTNNGLFKNIPALKYLYPNIIKPTAAEDGWYYSTRRALAQGMRIPVVNLGARTAQYTNLLGAEAHGVAALDSRITGNQDQTQISKAVYGEGTISGMTGAALDAVLTLGRPTLGAKPSDVVGSTFRALENTSNKALGGVNNVPLQFDRAMQGSDVSYSKLVAEHGKLRIDSYLNAMLDRFAAANSARAQMQADIAGGAPALDGEAYDQRFTDLAHAARNDSGMLNAAKAELLVNPEDMAHAFWTQRDDIAENMGKNSKGFAAYLDAVDHGRNLVRDWGDTLVHPGVWDKIAQERQVIKDQNDVKAMLPLTSDGPPVDPQSVVPTKSYVKGNFPEPAPGKLGIAKKETQTASDARKVALDLMKRLKAAGHGDAVDEELRKSDLEDMAAELGSPAAHFIDHAEAASKEADAVQKEAFDYLTRELSYHPMELTALEPGPMVGKVMQAAKRLAADVSLPIDATREHREAFKALDDLGYKMVWGTDIGHQLSEPIAEPAVIASQRRLFRTLASKLGVNTEHFTNDAPGNVMKQDILRRWQEGANDGKVRFTAGMNAPRYYAWIAQQVEDTPLSTTGRTIFAAFRRLHEPAAKLMVASGKATGVNEKAAMEDAYHQIQNELGAANSTFAVMGRKKFVQAATAVPDELKALNRMNGVDEDTPLLTVKQAEWMHRQALQAAAARPMSMMGLSKWEDVFRASFTPLGAVADRKNPALSTLAARSAELPNDLIRARDALKFKYSPIFSARRVVKTAVKMAVYGVDAPTVTPLRALARMGETVPLEAARFLDRVYPEDAGARNGWDATDRFLQANDLFAYSPRHFQAYAAWDLKNQGKSIPEIRQALDKMFTYGDRTALERSLNTVWYPFSFEKSLYKGLGGYLLDNPGQRMALAGAMDAYHAVDQHVGIQKWLDKHLPVAKELEKLNAFTEGVGLGQFKGINAPLLNMFLPQHNKTPLSNRVLTAAVPAWNDLNALLLGYDPKTGKANLGGQIGDTLKVSYWYAANQAQDIQNRLTGTKPSILAQHRPAEDAAGQNEDGWQLRNALIAGLSDTINYNYQNPHAPYVFGTGPDVPPELRGQKIDRTTIGTLTQRFFPLFDPSQAAPLAQAKQAAADKFVAQVTAANPERGAAFRAFQQAADKVSAYDTKGQYDTAQLAGITQNFRNVAVNLSETDAGFLKFYNTYYLRLFGPIQNVTG